MRNFFRRRSTSGSLAQPAEMRRRFSLPSHQEIEVLHWMNTPQNDLTPRSEDILPTTSARPEVTPQVTSSDVESVALSETETLAYSRQQRMELQETFDDNYVAYLPFVIRRLRQESERETADSTGINARGAEGSGDYGASAEDPFDSDDEKTVASLVDELNLIMRRQTAKYNHKRLMIVVSEFIKNTTYVFPDAESFRTFKYLRSNNKRLRKNSLIVYEADGKIKRILGKASVPELSGSSLAADNIVDMRQHVIPLEYKLKGSGLPLFKILVPYMSSFRKRVPYMVFRKYKEVPAPPNSRTESEEDEKYETYDFCTVHLKVFQQYKRYVLHFTPENAAPFKIIAFQNNYRPFTDFNYKDTRFRVVGSSLVTAYLMNYNPELKLIVIDKEQTSLCDHIVNRPLHLYRRASTVNQDRPVAIEEVAPEDLDDPVPDENNRVLKEDEGGFFQVIKRNYIPNQMPPFGRFLDSCVYPIELLILPRKFSEVGKIELYQPLSENTHPDLTSTFSVNMDQLVLSTVLLMLRETALRTTNRYSNGSLVSRMSTIGAAPGVGPTAGIGYSYTATL
ncbi:CIC11C00000004034 [Sungouiella intermedia]|uniref:CIC11C00000004034 n=1 Tax=Sungouiella intermedia TaxID=45354 RepID=A0A1L0C317_9ASCO|nr:CIC11C00000004034 [[Candida] intermedia]